MDVEVTDEVHMRKDNGEANLEHNMRGNQSMTQIFTDREASTQNDDGNTKPYIGMEFESEEEARTYYDAYARKVGFSIQVGQYTGSKPDGPIVTWDFACSREVFRKKNIENCDAVLRIERKNSGNWVVTKFVEDHNHSTVSLSKVHCLKPRRHFAGATNNMVETQPSNLLMSMHGNPVCYDTGHGVRKASLVATDYPMKNTGPVNHVARFSHKRTLGRDAQNLFNFFKKMQEENPGFYYAIQLDDDNRMTNVFWAESRSRTAYRHFGDAVIFDTMYRPNQFQVPFALFTGVNNHGQMILFGCALLLDESESSFAWVFNTWLSAMNNCPPVSITTDQDRAIQSAVSHVFPETRHCISKWHILREGQERLSHIYLAHPSLFGELYSCINVSEAIDDFESSWCNLLDKYDLHKNEWLQAVYNARKQWAPVYFRDTFFAAFLSNQGVSSFFDGYVNQQTTLPSFLKQYERALEISLEREIEADYDTFCTSPPLKTPSPMEQQAANLYTKKVFCKFQEELVETFVYTANKIEGDAIVSKFRVAKYEHDHKAYVVSLNISELKASCSCQMFEYSGILCRHILTVFTVTNVLTLPSHYILKRWTKNARAGLGSDEQDADGQAMVSLTSRFNKLCCEAIKFAEEGAMAPETFSAAMNALREGSSKIATVKRDVAKIIPRSHFSGAKEEVNKNNPTLISDWSSLAWPRQETVPHLYNLNDVGIPVTSLNQPIIGPVSLSHDGSSSEMVVLARFKSMTWIMENNNSSPGSKVAVINLQLHDYGKTLPEEREVQFRLTRVTLEPMLKSLAYISQQLSDPSCRVAVINLKLQDTKTSTGETEVKFQISRDSLGSMSRSMAYIHEQL